VNSILILAALFGSIITGGVVVTAIYDAIHARVSPGETTTAREVQRMNNADEFRGDVCQHLREHNHDWLADAVGGLSDHFMQAMGESTEWNVALAAHFFIHGEEPQ